tara:strand:+ start:1798 stop:2310 length:513 start_codon:yes stop_codon:yes gene_type:complete
MIKENIFTKLQKLQNEIGSISKEATNPFYNSKYFDINSLIKQLQPLLEKNKLVLIQPIESDYETGNEYVVTKIICPDTEKSVESRKKLSNQNEPQKLGSEITYYRRYTLQSLLALQAEDDDANSTGKPWLNLNTPQFIKAKNFLKEGGVFGEITKKYKLSKKVQDELTRL